MKVMNDVDTLMTPAEVAKRLGVSPITVRSWVAKGWLDSRVTPGGHRRFRWDDVEKLLAERGQPRSAPPTVKVLIVDDDPQFRAYLTDALSVLAPDAGLREASDGFQAGIEMASFRPDLVILDYAMPGLNGAAVCRLIRSNAAYANTRIVAVTGYADATIEAALHSAGADAVLHKPLPLAAIEGILDQLKLRASA